LQISCIDDILLLAGKSFSVKLLEVFCLNSGVIFDIKEFAIYDGPGIRQTVFLKGCPLRCSWCHNPEGLDPAPELLVNRNTGISRVFGEVLTAAELAGRILENADYYHACGGGVTFSGGEPLLQPEFLSETLSLLPDIHKTIETSGFSEPDTFREIIHMTDLVMMDVKMVDTGKHIKYTGQDNGCILENLRYLCQSGVPSIIRIPVIPGVNDDADNYAKTAELIKDSKSLVRVELLPFHKTAGAKYDMYGIDYEPMFDVDREGQYSTDIFADYGITSVIL